MYTRMVNLIVWLVIHRDAAQQSLHAPTCTHVSIPGLVCHLLLSVYTAVPGHQFLRHVRISECAQVYILGYDSG